MRTITALLSAAVIIVALLLVGRFYYSDTNYNPMNPAWNGMAGLSGNMSSLYSISSLSSAPSGSTLLIIGPTESYSESESNQILSFLHLGGKVVVMDDYGTSNSLLNSINSPVTLNQQPLCQDSNYYHKPSFPIITSIRSQGLFSGVGKLVLNHPVPLDTARGATILASTSNMAWIDADNNGSINGNEKYSEYPVAASVKYGAGELIVIGDSDLLINGMSDLGDDSVLKSNIFRSGIVYIDVSHGQSSQPLAVAYNRIKTDPVAQFICVLVILLSGYLFYRRESIYRMIAQDELINEDPQEKKDAIISFMKIKQ
ncbi:MAG TPA: DUF4350 domain-containing protein, partial [Methanocella sp.]|nr:DUF4350 domain-containing protein [Methanocella sp.]